nr:arsenate reductase [uncultured bacterium]
MSTYAPTSPPEFIKLISHDLRWALLKALTTSDHRVQELVTLINQPMNLVSYHLKKLRDNEIVTTRRSEADARDIYYSLDIGKLRTLYQTAGISLHPALANATFIPPQTKTIPPSRVLFVCTHNSARSQMSEGLMRHVAGQQIEVFSAGNQPTSLHPDAIRTMDALGIDIRGQQPRHIQEFAGQTFDYVITVCDRAREVCPEFPGERAQIHWGFTDPAEIEDTRERRRVFKQIAAQLTSRIEYFLVSLSERPGHNQI